MLAFSKVITEYGSYMVENAPLVITGRFSVRDDKDPQIVINRARPMSDFANEKAEPEKSESSVLYLRLPTENGSLFDEVRALLGKFPGNCATVVYFADTKQRRGTRCALDAALLQQLTELLGKDNVVLK
jgi:DNA polymerase-3 subunit alpha